MVPRLHEDELRFPHQVRHVAGPDSRPVAYIRCRFQSEGEKDETAT